MGIYDRDYVREAPRARGGVPGAVRRGVGMWSVTTWLILICVAIFIIDGFLPQRDVWTGRLVNLNLTEGNQLYQLSPDAWYLGPQAVRQTITLPNGVVMPGAVLRSVHERSTTRQIGWAEVYRMRFLESYLHFSTRLAFFWPYMQFWRFIGFQFLHANLTHLLFNMIGLYFIGPLVEEYLGRKRYLAFYLLCGIFGACMYLLLNLAGQVLTTYMHEPVAVPGLIFNDPSTPLVGASAGIFGVLMAGAYLAPNIIVLLFFILPMRLRTVAYAFVALALVTLLTGGRNAGGEAGHLGGAIAGFYFIRRPHHLHNFFDILGRADPTSHHYRATGSPSERAQRRRTGRAAEVDRILDKINTEGLHSLTDSEKRTLADASERVR